MEDRERKKGKLRNQKCMQKTHAYLCMIVIVCACVCVRVNLIAGKE